VTVPRFQTQRQMTPDQAGLLVGDHAPDLKPNVTEAGLWMEDDEPVLLYTPVPGGADDLRMVCGVEHGDVLRGYSGWKSDGRTFGYKPRSALRRAENCSPTTLTHDRPDADMALRSVAARLTDLFVEEIPAVAEADRQTLREVLAEWRLGDSIWTSGVINWSATLPYHRDTMNYDSWSAMPVLRYQMAGGHLHLPEYDLVIACRDGWQVSFWGRGLVHGVTPMRPKVEGGYRVSIVYYSLKGMRSCREWAEEVALGRSRRTTRERAAAGLEP
jgi:hypothetical protein